LIRTFELKETVMIRRTSLALCFLFAAGFSHAYSPAALVISPSTFDFGWCPDNAKVHAEFTVRNTGTDLIPITGVQPTCGCTTSEFTPGSLASNEESKVGLTFNTRGYAGAPFHKNAKVKTDSNAEYTVTMTGYVLNPAASVVPEGDGVAGFDPGSSVKKQTIEIKNKGPKDVTLKVVQPAAAWANVKFDATALKAGQNASMTVAPEGSFDEERTTSITVEATDGATYSRFTVAVRTGPPPPPMRDRQGNNLPRNAPSAAPVKK
jgi:hypothetical protein